jgi:purine-nucleoside phosphorylase
MSTAPEVVVARQCGLRVLGLSLITDMCMFEYETEAGPSHEDVLKTTVHRAEDMQNLVTNILAHIA